MNVCGHNYFRFEISNNGVYYVSRIDIIFLFCGLEMVREGRCGQVKWTVFNSSFKLEQRETYEIFSDEKIFISGEELVEF